MTFGLCCLLALSRVPRLLSTCQTPRPPCSPVRAGHDGIETADCRILGASSAPRVVLSISGVGFFSYIKNEPLRRQLPQKQTCSAVLFLRMSDKTPPKLITRGLFLTRPVNVPPRLSTRTDEPLEWRRRSSTTRLCSLRRGVSRACARVFRVCARVRPGV